VTGTIRLVRQATGGFRANQESLIKAWLDSHETTCADHLGSGVHPGIFRLQISKKDTSGQETIPAKYNTQTTLGVEARTGNPAVAHGLELKLFSR
jgi:hypothetical protein